MYGLLADVLVGIHFAFVAFVVVGQLLIMIGAVLRWQWVRNPWFRVLHLLCIAIVATEAMFNYECPCTTWENQLREAAGQKVSDATFMGRLFHNLLFYDCPQDNFPPMHIGFGVLVLVTFLLVPPRFRRRPPQTAPVVIGPKIKERVKEPA
jgi:hypothetical protein